MGRVARGGWNFDEPFSDARLVLESVTNADISSSAAITESKLSLNYPTHAEAHVHGDATNYTEFESDGTLVMHGDATVWDDLRIEPSVRDGSGRPPAFEKYFDDVAGSSRGVYLYSFNDEAVNEKEIHFTMQMPHSWDASSIYIHAHWTPKELMNSSAVKWGLEYAWVSIGGTFTDTATLYTATTTSGDVNLAAGKHYLSSFAAISPGTTANGLSSILIGRFFRNSSHSDDTYTGKSAGLLYLDAHFRMNTIGSRSELSK